MSDAASSPNDGPRGTSTLPRDLTEEELAAVPVLLSVDALLDEEMTDEEADAFAAALDE